MYVKTVLCSALVFIYAIADNKNITPLEHRSIHNYNQKTGLKPSTARKIELLDHIDEKKIKKLASSVTGESIKTIKLSHRGRLLLFYIKTNSYNLIIDAKNGTIIKKEQHD